jgi:UDP-glucose 4-epimerase/UDP-glucuronate decarboxylase
MTKVLILGGAGFIGLNCLKYLSVKKGYGIDVVDNLSRGKMDDELKNLLKSPLVRFIEGDLTEPRTFSYLSGDYDYIYHLVAVVGVKNVIDNPDKVLFVNTLSILNLLEWLKDKAKNLKRLLFASTSEVYAETLRKQDLLIPTPESVDLIINNEYPPRATYALSKIFGESACMTYAKKYGFPVTIVRFHNVYGPRMGFSHVIPELLIKASSENGSLGVYSVDHSRAFCYIDDAVKAVVRLTENIKAENKIVHIGNSKEEVTIGQLAKHIVEIVNPSLTIKPLGEHEGSPLRRCPDTTELEGLIDFSPEISLQEGLEKTWAWYKNHIESTEEEPLR